MVFVKDVAIRQTHSQEKKNYENWERKNAYLIAE